MLRVLLFVEADRGAFNDVATVLADVGAAIDALGGSFTMSYTTVAVTAARSA